MKLFQTLTSKSRFQILPAVSEKIFKEFLISVECKKSPPHGGHVFPGIKISQTVFEKGHPRDNPVIFF